VQAQAPGIAALQEFNEAIIPSDLRLTLATRPTDEGHAYGHSKAEYIPSALERPKTQSKVA
jgi:hypothetical protein